MPDDHAGRQPLVGMMQSAIQQKDLGSIKVTTVTITRIITYNLRAHTEHEYLYTLDNPTVTGTANGEITALFDTTFLVDERDGKFPPSTFKKRASLSLSASSR